MSDVVDRLRSFGPDWSVKYGGHMIPYEVCADAAAEIERLRDEVQRYIIARMHPDENDCCVAFRAEIERLRAGFKEYACTGTDHPCGCYDEFVRDKNEIERLRALKTPATHKLLNIAKGALDGAEAEGSQLRAEIRRLRKALEPFQRNVEAASLLEALGHISREHLWNAQCAYTERD